MAMKHRTQCRARRRWGPVRGLTMGIATAAPLNIADVPLFLPGTVPPLNMLVMGRDHRMYYEAYNDASDLDGDGDLDSGYQPDEIDYYGYFDSHRCYTLRERTCFRRRSATADKTCGGASEWSGDWLNYMTMSRIDAMRKVLYGGLRSTDTATETVLQRAFIPQDAHSWGKEYTSVATDGYDIEDYTPLGQPAGNGHAPPPFSPTRRLRATPCKYTRIPAINGVALPLFRVSSRSCRTSRIWNWVSIERPVAGTAVSRGINASGGETRASHAGRLRRARAGLRTGTYDPLATNCRSYGSNAKPTGLLQDYGESDTMLFGLLTGSYGKPHDGGVLRKAVDVPERAKSISNTGQFYLLTPPGIINTIDRLRITSFHRHRQYGLRLDRDSSDAAGNARCGATRSPK